MGKYIWAAFALEFTNDEYTGESVYEPGDQIGRTVGYLSRSAAKAAGEAAGVRYVLVKSNPITFPKPIELELVEARERIQELELAEIRRKLSAVAR